MLARALLGKESSVKTAAKISSIPAHGNQQLSTEPPRPEHEFTAPKFFWSIGTVAISAPSDGQGTNSGDDGGPTPAARRLARLPWPIQAKLEVGAVDDPLEREADRVAEQVMRMPDPKVSSPDDTARGSSSNLQSGSPTASDATVQRKCSCEGSCEKCKIEKTDDEHAEVKRKPAAPNISNLGASPVSSGMTAPPIVHEVLRSPGQPLDAENRDFFEPRFGYDLGQVRLHSDGKAIESARAVHARAYTVGRDIILGASPHGSAIPAERSLLAHELVHVVQERRGPLLQRQEWADTPEGHGCDLAPPLPEPELSKMKPVGRDRAIAYSINLSRGTFCEIPRKSVALLQYKRKVHVRTAWGLEATLQIGAVGAYFPANALPGVPEFDPSKSSVEQIRQRGWADLTWDVEVRYAGLDQKALNIQLADIDLYWHSLLKRPRNIRTENKSQSLSELAQQEPPFVHFFLSPAAQQNSLEEFATARACIEIPKLCKAVADWKKKHPQHEQPKSEPTRAKEQKRPEHQEPLDTFDRLSEDQKYDLAREQIWERTKDKLAYMLQHPGETLKGLGASALLLNTPETFRAMGENLTEFLDQDSDLLARAAAGTGLLSKLLGWLAGAALVLGAAVYAASWLTGIGEAATLLGVGLAAGTALFAGSIGLGAAESVLRAKAASKSKTLADFNRQVEEGSSSLANGIVGVAMLATAAVVHSVVKGLVPKDVQQKIGSLLEDFRRRLKKPVGKAGQSTKAVAPRQPGPIPGSDSPSDRAPATPDQSGAATTDFDKPDAAQGTAQKTQNGNTTPQPTPKPGAPDLSAKAAGEARLPDIQAIKRPIKLAGKTHTLSIKQFGKQLRVWLCSNGCGALIAKVEGMIAKLPAKSAARAELKAFIKEVEQHATWIDVVPETKEAQVALDELGAELEKLQKKYPSGVNADIHVPATGGPSGVAETPAAEPVPAEAPTTPQGGDVFSRNGLSTRGLDPDLTLEEQLGGTSQLKDLQASPNLQGVGASDLPKLTPRQLAEMVEEGKITKKVFDSIMKTGEHRNLGGG